MASLILMSLRPEATGQDSLRNLQHLLTAHGGASHALISLPELKYRAELRKIRRDSDKPPSTEQKRVCVCPHVLLCQDYEAIAAMLDYDGEGESLIHVNILRVNRHIYEEAKNIIYEKNTFSIALSVARPNEPLHYQFINSWKLTNLRCLRVTLGGYDDYGFSQGRSYGIWSSFLHLPALRELHIVVVLDRTSPQCVEGCWNTSTDYTQTVRNISAALPKHVRLTPVEKSPTAYGQLTSLRVETGRGCATSDDIRELLELFQDVRGTDAENWAGEVGLEPLVGLSSSGGGGRGNNTSQLIEFV